jgi:LAS superfamily LD-carboxypeptidase LdcB
MSEIINIFSIENIITYGILYSIFGNYIKYIYYKKDYINSIKLLTNAYGVEIKNIDGTNIHCYYSKIIGKDMNNKLDFLENYSLNFNDEYKNFSKSNIKLNKPLMDVLKNYKINESTIESNDTLIDVLKKYEIHEEVSDFLVDLLEEAEDDEIDLKVISAFRSFNEQAQLKGAYTIQYGSGANQFSADQGYSEHQLGTTIDFTTSEVGATFSGFAQTEAYEWLQKNAHKFGFTLSYPENNQYYQFEPWHWRFVGKDLADDLRDDGIHFYDLSQRDIDKYILNLFD